MSQDPFHQHNPYAAPGIPYASPSADDRAAANGSNPLLIPGLFLLIMGVLSLLIIFASMPAQVIRITAIDTSTADGMIEMLSSVITLVVWICMLSVVILGSVSMIRLKGYSSAIIAAVCSIIPVCSPCFLLGIPFGIWALVLLLKADVKARFQ